MWSAPRRFALFLSALCLLIAGPFVAGALAASITPSNGFTAVTAGASPVTLDPGVTFSDSLGEVHAVTLTVSDSQGTVGPTGTLVAQCTDPTYNPTSGDSLVLTNPVGNLWVVEMSPTGNGCGPADFQAALRMVTFASSVTGSRTVFWEGRDNFNSPVAGTSNGRAVQVTSANSAPSLSLPASTSYTEGAGAQAVAPGLTVSDADSANLAGATVTISSNFSASDTLGYTATAGVSGSFNPGTATLTLSGTATVATWQQVLRSVTFSNSSDLPSTATRTITFTVNDGTDTASRSITMTFTAVNDVPQVLVGGTVAYTENGAPVSVGTGLLLSDADNATLSWATVRIVGNFASGQDVLAFTNDGATMGNVSGSWAPGTGMLTLTSSGSTASVAQWQAALRTVTYANTSDTPFTDDRLVAFTVNDGTSTSASGARWLTVTAANDAPVLTTSGGTTAFTEGAGAAAVDAGIVVSDADTSSLASATVSITGNFAQGQDVLAFTNTNATAYGNIVGSYSVGVLTLTSAGATAATAQWQAVLRAVTYNNVSVAPSTSTRTVSFRVNDGTANSTTATKSLSVAAVDTPPVVTTTAGTTAFTEDGGPVVVDSGVDADDVDGIITSAKVSITGNFASGQDVLALPTQAFDITGSWNGSMGALTLSAGSALTRAQWVTALRAVTYDNTSQAPGTAVRTMAFTVADGAMQLGTATKTVSVAGTADSPVVSMTGSTLSVAEGVATPIDAGLVVTDADVTGITAGQVSVSGGLAGVGDVLAFTNDGSTMGNIAGSYDAASRVLSLASAGGMATAAQWQAALRAVTYTNTSNTPDLTARSIEVRVRDGDARQWVAAIRALQVTAVNDAPSWTPITISIPMDDEWVFGSTTDLAFPYSDPEDDPLAQVKVTSVGAWGSVRDCNGPLTLPATVSPANFLGSGPCPLRFVPVPGALDSNTITLEVSDGGLWSLSSQLTLATTATPPPVVVDGGVVTVPVGATVPVSGGLVLGSTLAPGLPNSEVRVASGGAAGDALGISVDFALPGQIISVGNDPLALDLVSFANQATPGQWQAALRTVTFRAGSTPGIRTITFEVSNGLAASRATVRVQVPDPAPPAGGGGGAPPAAPGGQQPAAAPAIVKLTPAARVRATFSTAVGKAKVARTTALAACATRPPASRVACRTAARRTYTRTVALATAVRTRDLALARCAAKRGTARATCTKAANTRYARDRARASRR